MLHCIAYKPQQMLLSRIPLLMYHYMLYHRYDEHMQGAFPASHICIVLHYLIWFTWAGFCFTRRRRRLRRRTRRAKRHRDAVHPTGEFCGESAYGPHRRSGRARQGAPAGQPARKGASDPCDPWQQATSGKNETDVSRARFMTVRVRSWREMVWCSCVHCEMSRALVYSANQLAGQSTEPVTITQ